MLIAGAVDGLMGAADDNTSLALFGFLLAMAGLLGLTLSVSHRGQINHLSPANIKLLDSQPLDASPLNHQRLTPPKGSA
ncbi:MAG: hypothetical protein HC929_18430, partial [Leptolyngbyaceae cyanobacterium SM2_5_2]|nr:hypothetical protein [Leptolyngbyaceae cyanobacterium SM2_5_2]